MFSKLCYSVSKNHVCFGDFRLCHLHVFHFFFELNHDASGILMMENLKRWGRQRDREGRGGDKRKRNPDADAALWRTSGRRRWRET